MVQLMEAQGNSDVRVCCIITWAATWDHKQFCCGAMGNNKWFSSSQTKGIEDIYVGSDAKEAIKFANH